MGLESTIKATVELDKERGVIYVHSNRTGRTLIRVCGLAKAVVEHLDQGLLDVTASSLTGEDLVVFITDANVDIGPKRGDVFYHITGADALNTWMGIAYQVQDDVHHIKAVATAVSGSRQKVRSMLQSKVKHMGLTPPGGK